MFIESYISCNLVMCDDKTRRNEEVTNKVPQFRFLFRYAGCIVGKAPSWMGI